MRRLHTGVIIFDTLDIVCLSISAGSSMAYLVKKYKETRTRRKRGEDPIVTELIKKSPVIIASKIGKPLRLPLVRGGEMIRGLRGFSLVIKNKKLAILVRAIVNAKKKTKAIKIIAGIFFYF